MRQQLLAELTEALEEKEKLLREQEEAMRKDEMDIPINEGIGTGTD